MKDMNVVILIAGRGSRFSGYGNFPKPMIEVEGRSILQRTTDSLSFLNNHPRNKLWFGVLQEHINTYQIDSWLKGIYGEEINIIVMPQLTRGNLETAKIITDKIFDNDINELLRPLLILDGDNEYKCNEIEFTMNSNTDYACIYWFEPIDISGKWCYAMINNGFVYDLKEKNIHAQYCGGKPMVGVFYFSRGFLFRNTANSVILNENTTANNEFYMSQTINELIKRRIPVSEKMVYDVIPLGTPEDVKRVGKKLTICLDLDDTINICKRPEDNYGSEDLQPHVLEVLRRWKERGYYIIIQTARHMNTCQGNVGKVLAKQGLSTLEWLKNNKIPYDEIYFGKPHADLFIDDKAIQHENWMKTEEIVAQFAKE